MSAVQSKTPKRGRRLPVAEREAFKAARREEERAAIEASVRELLSSDGWQRWASVRSRFHRYSLCNQLLIAHQMPEATYVAGYRAWQGMNRQVLKGEHGIRIMAPMNVRRLKADAPATQRPGISGSSTIAQVSRNIADQAKARPDSDYESLTLFRAVSVFDVSQTDGEDLPEIPRSPIEGDSHAHYLPALETFAGELGYSVSFEDLGESIGGYCRKGDSPAIAVNTRASVNGQVRTLVHELAHALGVGYAEYGRPTAEVIVETAAIIVCATIGLDTSGESIPYLASWGEADDLAAIREYAAKVDECASRIETALGERA